MFELKIKLLNHEAGEQTTGPTTGNQMMNFK